VAQTGIISALDYPRVSPPLHDAALAVPVSAVFKLP